MLIQTIVVLTYVVITNNVLTNVILISVVLTIVAPPKIYGFRNSEFVFAKFSDLSIMAQTKINIKKSSEH